MILKIKARNSSALKVLSSPIKLVLIIGCYLPFNCLALDTDVNIQNERLREQSKLAINSQQQAIIDAATPEIDEIMSVDQANHQQITPETAIFMAINQHNWVLLEEMTKAYVQLADADPNLVLFARASLQAGRGNISKAIQSFQSLLMQQPNFVRARLELARLYYQDGLLKESQQEFEQVLQSPQLPQPVITNIEAYLEAILQKQSFNGTFAIAAGYEFNINESSESTTCLYPLADGKCGYIRSTPKAIDSMAINIETTLNHNWQLWDHHGATLSFLGCGTDYNKQQANNFSNSTLNLSAGYRYQDYAHELSLTPLMEYRHQDDQKLYFATGARVSYGQNLTYTTLGKWLTRPLRASVDVEYKDFNYQEDYAHNDGDQWSVYSSLYLTTNPNNQWFVNLDYLDRNNREKPNAYQQKGAGVGVHKRWNNGLISTIMARYRKREHKAKSTLLGATRQDQQLSLYGNVRMPKLSWHGFEPSLSYQYRHNNSNIDWLYDYETSSVWLKMSRVF